MSVDTVGGYRSRPQSWNRYSYVLGNPVKYVDPDGRFAHIVVGGLVGGIVGAGSQAIKNRIQGRPIGEGVWAAAGVGAAAGAIGAATFGIGTAVLGTGVGATVVSGTVSGAAGGFVQGAGNAFFVEGQRNGRIILAAGGDSAMQGAIAGAPFGALSAPYADAMTPLDDLTLGIFSALAAETSALVDLGSTAWQVVDTPEGAKGTLTVYLGGESAANYSLSLARSLHTFGGQSSTYDLFNAGMVCIDGVCVPPAY